MIKIILIIVILILLYLLLRNIKIDGYLILEDRQWTLHLTNSPDKINKKKYVIFRVKKLPYSRKEVMEYDQGNC